jgi:organic hydroperoxide reductase OsmC/OhrA
MARSLSVAQSRRLDASDSIITAYVAIGPTDRGAFGLTVALDLHAPHLSRVDAEDLMGRAHGGWPYSNAIRGDVDVPLSIDGTK